MATYQVRLVNPELGMDATIAVADGQYVLDAAEKQGLTLPADCRAGSCYACAGKLTAGTVEQDGRNFLDAEELAAGYVLTCVTRPTSDCTIETHKEGELE